MGLLNFQADRPLSALAVLPTSPTLACPPPMSRVPPPRTRHRSAGAASPHSTRRRHTQTHSFNALWMGSATCWKPKARI